MQISAAEAAEAAEADARSFRATPEGTQIMEPYRNNTSLFPVPAALANTLSNPTLPQIASMPHMFNSSTWERMYNNYEVTVMASSARTATTNSSEVENFNGKGIVVTWNIASVPGGDTVNLYIQFVVKGVGSYETALTSGAKSAQADHMFIVYPGGGAAANGIDVVTGYPVPRKWRARVVHSGSASFTYQVVASHVL